MAEQPKPYALATVSALRLDAHDDDELLREIATAVASMMAGLRRHSSRQKYAAALRAFSSFLGAPGPIEALHALVEGGATRSKVAVASWVECMEKSGLAAATRAQRLAALKAAVAALHEAELIAWLPRWNSVRVTPLRDVRGPNADEVRSMFRSCDSRPRTAPRDRAILALLAGLGLRREEAARLDVSDLDREAATLRVLGKARDDYELVAVPPSVLAYLCAYLDGRGAEPSEPLLVGIDGRSTRAGRRLTGSAIYEIVRQVARAAGVEHGGRRVGAHKLRHSAITAALDATNGDVRRVQRFSRHRKVDVVLAYDDARLDVARDVAGAVAATLIVPMPAADLSAGPPGAPLGSSLKEGVGMGVSASNPGLESQGDDTSRLHGAGAGGDRT